MVILSHVWAKSDNFEIFFENLTKSQTEKWTSLVHFSVWDFQNYSKSQKINFENALRATVLKIQPWHLVHISFSHQRVPPANLGQIRQL